MLAKVWIQNFRNINQLNVVKQNKYIFFIGKNNQGKTTILEAIYILLTGGWLKEKDRNALIQFSKERAVIGGEWQLNEEEQKQVYLSLSKSEGVSVVINKQCSRDKKTFTKNCFTDYLSSDINRQFQDSAAQRRHFLDTFCTQYFTEYRQSLNRFQSVCKQKNAWIKQDVVDQKHGDILNKQLAILSGSVLEYRIEGLRRLSEFFKKTQEIFFVDILENIQFKYMFHRLDIEEFSRPLYQEVLFNKLQEDKQKERFLGYSLVGPHRDDFDAISHDQSVFRFFSKGINRVFAVLTKLAHWDLVSEKFQQPLILLLDDIFAELDSEVKTKLATYLKKYDQLFLTGVNSEDIGLFNDIDVYQVEKGKIHCYEAA
ncbi:MAG: DNA replication and repair protein RecF [bacterium]